MTLCYTHRKKDPFVRLDKRIVLDPSISWKAKGLLCYAFSRPEDWKFYKHEMMQHASDGEKSFDSGIKELEKAGYLHRKNKHEEGTGRFSGLDWHFFEEPISEEEFKKFFRKPPFGGTAERPVPLKGSPTKKEQENKKENNKQDTQIAKKTCQTEAVTPSAVVVVSSQNKIPINPRLKELNISQKLKAEISESYDDSQIEQALIAVSEIKNIRSLEASLLAALKGSWKPKVTQESQEESNRSWAKKVLEPVRKHIIGRGFTLNICTKFVEIAIGCTNKIFEYDSCNFKKDLTEYVRRLLPIPQN